MNINALHSNCGQGDKGAEERLFESLSVRFRFFAEQKIRDRLDAEEVCQKALTVVFEKYRAIVFETSFSAWAHRVLDNEILKHYRTHAYHENLFMPMEDDGQSAAAWNPDPELKRRLLGCMKRICDVNSRYARTLNLKYQGYEAEDICRMLKITANNLYVILSRARSLLRLCLDKGDIG